MRVWYIALFVYILLLIPYSVSAYTESNGAFYCNNCTDCTDALNNNTYTIVYLNTSNSSSNTCIDNPENFTSKIFDCQGYNITGSTNGYGIYLYDKDNITIRNCEIYNFSAAIHVSLSSNTTITNNTVYSISPMCETMFGGTYTYGVYLNSSTNSLITGNTAGGNSSGNVSFCSVNVYGIYLDNSSYVNVTNNNASFIESKCTVTCISGAHGIYLSSSSNNTLLNNTADSNVVYFFGSPSNGLPAANGIILVSSTNNTLINNTMRSNAKTGFWIETSSNNTLIENMVSSSEYGINLYNANAGNVLIKNNMSGNTLNFFISGSQNQNYNQAVYPSNIIDYSHRIYYNYSISDYTFNPNTAPEAGTVICANCYNISVRDINTSHYSAAGVEFFNTTNSIIENVTANLNYYGISMQYDSDNIIVRRNTVESNFYGIFLYINITNNTITNNTVRSNSASGVAVSQNSDNNTISNNVLVFNTKSGVDFTLSDNNTVTNNNFLSNSYGVYFQNSINNSIFSNTFRKGVRPLGLWSEVDYHNINSNEIIDSMNFTSNFSTTSQEIQLGSIADFNFTVKYMNESECTQFSYDVKVSPEETNLSYSSSGSLITGNFTPTRIGMYSMTINITYPNNNSHVRKYMYFINSTANASVSYYFRSQEPTHGQPKALGGYDSGSLVFEAPTSDEERYCGGWVEFNPDKLPEYLFGIYKEVNYSITYSSAGGGSTGVDRYSAYDNEIDSSTAFSSTSENKVFDSFNFTINWPMDYFWNAYFLGVKLLSSGSPYIYTNATNPSVANITYIYSTSPAIKSISNEDIDILSATMPADGTNETLIVLNGAGNTNMTVELAGLPVEYFVTYDNDNCSTSSCSYTLNGTEMNFTLTLSSEHNISIGEIKDNNNSCSANSECNSTYCVHGICRPESTYCGDNYCDSGETCSSCKTDCGLCSSSSSPSTITGEVVFVNEDECNSDSDCKKNEYCYDGECFEVECNCGYMEDHVCTKYDCCKDSECLENQKCKDNKCVFIEDEITEHPPSIVSPEESQEGDVGYYAIASIAIVIVVSIVLILFVLNSIGIVKII